MWHVVEAEQALEQHKVTVDEVCIEFCTQLSKRTRTPLPPKDVRFLHMQHQQLQYQGQQAPEALPPHQAVDKQASNVNASRLSRDKQKPVLPALSKDHDVAEKISSPSAQVHMEKKSASAKDKHISRDEEHIHGNYSYFEADDNVPVFTVQVSGFPSFCTKNTVMMFLHNKKKSGGGQFDIYTYDDTERTAVVTFNQSEGIVCGSILSSVE